MKHVLTLFLVACSCIVSAQSEYCLDGTVWDAALGGCVPEVLACGFDTDLDGDGAVGSSDLLALLTDYGFVVVDDDSDGVCDDIDECVGEYDECGVCNGPGAVYDCGCGECLQCDNPVSYQGYDYATVLIGDQCWFAENLRSENYANGDAISSNLIGSDWFDTTSGAVGVYGGDGFCEHYSPDIDACDPTQSLNEYGRLYNWFAVYDSRGLCPIGWHVPTIGEWQVMTDYLGGDSIAGGQMKTDYGWYDGGGGTNASGFTGLPGGFSTGGDFIGAGYVGMWWSSTLWQSDPVISEDSVITEQIYTFRTQLYSNIEDVDNNAAGPLSFSNGLSVRCIKDTE
jgi:uncharacterized protein (TIGR02145 family)